MKKKSRFLLLRPSTVTGFNTTLEYRIKKFKKKRTNHVTTLTSYKLKDERTNWRVNGDKVKYQEWSWIITGKELNLSIVLPSYLFQRMARWFREQEVGESVLWNAVCVIKCELPRLELSYVPYIIRAYCFFF